MEKTIRLYRIIVNPLPISCMKSIALFLIAAVAAPVVLVATTSCSPGYTGNHVHPGDVSFNQHGRYKHGKRTHAEKKYLRPR